MAVSIFCTGGEASSRDIAVEGYCCWGILAVEEYCCMGYCCKGGTAVGNTAEEDTGFLATVGVQVAEEFERI